MRKYLLIILALAAGWFASGEALAQPLRTVAVIDAVKFPPKAKLAHERLRAALEEALSPKNWFLAEQHSIADCGGTIDCLTKVANDIKSNYVLRLSGTRTQDDGYDITLELYTSATSRIQRSGAYCDYCDPQRINEVTSKTVVGMLASALKEEADIRASKQAAPPPVPAAPPPALAPAPMIVTPPPAVEPARYSWIPWTMIGVGVLAAGYGAWSLSKDGQSNGDPSPGAPTFTQSTYSTKAQGWGCLVGGGAVAIAGAIWVFTMPSHTTTISAFPNHVAIGMRF